jgi:hypothetical protein
VEFVTSPRQTSSAANNQQEASDISRLTPQLVTLEFLVWRPSSDGAATCSQSHKWHGTVIQTFNFPARNMHPTFGDPAATNGDGTGIMRLLSARSAIREAIVRTVGEPVRMVICSIRANLAQLIMRARQSTNLLKRIAGRSDGEIAERRPEAFALTIDVPDQQGSDTRTNLTFEHLAQVDAVPDSARDGANQQDRRPARIWTNISECCASLGASSKQSALWRNPLETVRPAPALAGPHQEQRQLASSSLIYA